MWRNKRPKHQPKNRKIKIRYLILATIFSSLALPSRPNARAESCPDLKIVFVRGSGAERNTNNDFLNFKSNIEEKLNTVTLNYQIVDLDYPAISVGADNLGAAIGALFGAGEAYEFGDSVKTGVANLTNLVNSSCANTRYVIGGYSQGAMVVSKALSQLMPERVIYAATFGDPKLYLPEGAGIMPDACRGVNLSDYRMYVPDCYAHKGLLGAHIPYQPEAYIGKLGTWCNKGDIFCSVHFSIGDHVRYVEDNLYEDASRVIFHKVVEYFGIESTLASPHDTAFLIDSTGSMQSMIDRYKQEALRLATETFNIGGRVALYDYRDLDDPYDPVEHCNFENCTLESFTEELNKIVADNGGDIPESLLSASFNLMTNLTWRRGATKSLVVLTDSDFLSPDRDGVTYDQVVKLSKSIDPVNFYIITNPEHADAYQPLADDTDGKVVTNFDELTLLTEYIIGRYDSLPRVEENDAPVEKPVLEILSATQTDTNKATVKFETNGKRAIVILNETILGITDEAEIVLHDVDFTKENTIALVPINDNVRGDAVFANLSMAEGTNEESETQEETTHDIVIPKVPDTGRR